MTDPSSPREALIRAVKAPPEWLRQFKASLSIPGILVATLFFAGSLTPSLLPRGWMIQGVLSGFCTAVGYALGVLYRWLWEYLELPLAEDRMRRIILWGAGGACVAITLGFLWQASEWQNSVRTLMELEPVDTARPIRVGLLAYLVFALVLGFSRLFHFTYRVFSGRLGQGMPRRVANVISLLMAATLFWAVIDGVLFQQALRFADTTFQRIDAREGIEVARPSDPDRTGSAASLVAWDDLGRTGRNFVSTATTIAELEPFAEGPPTEPVRVYVGLNAAATPEERARLALAELDRVGGFERSVLVVVTPTGTGWVDPAAISTLEYLHRGDVASVALQYSYLPSWLTLLTDEAYGTATADALFDAVYGRWTELPPETRPALYLYGMSLGAQNSQQSADLYDVIADPFAGALWVGPPFRSEPRLEITRQRTPDSPPWLPRFRDGSVVRFMNQWDVSHPPDTPWGPLRIVYLQYAGDPITLFGPEVFYRRPEWLEEPRGRDVSDRIRWYPVVTALQLLADFAVADAAPVGYGHVYAPEHYVDAWIAVTDPPGWTDEGVERLKRLLSERE